MTEEEFKEFDSLMKKTRFDVREIMSTKKRFTQVYDMLYNYMKMGFEEERVRKHPLLYSFDGNKVYEMEIRHFIVNMICWYPMTKIGKPEDLDETFVLNCKCLNSGQIMEFFNDHIIEPYRDCVPN